VTDSDLPLLFTRTQAQDLGVTRHQVDHRVRTGAWTTLRRGYFSQTHRFDLLPPREQHLVRLVATLRMRGEDDVASHLSACVVYDWPVPLDGAGAVTVTSADLHRSARREDGAVVQVATLPVDELATAVAMAGEGTWPIRLTSAARTVADCLRHQLLPDGVAIGDHALRIGATTWPRVQRVLERQREWPYSARGHRAIALLDPRRESWLESFSFTILHLHGVPLPQPQVTVYDAKGRFVGRLDGWLDDEAVALEADGRAKYLLDDHAPADLDVAATEVARRVRRAMRAERERELRLRDLGIRVVRWGTADVVRSPSCWPDGSTGPAPRGTAAPSPAR
jgi:hypothetical protein